MAGAAPFLFNLPSRGCFSQQPTSTSVGFSLCVFCLSELECRLRSRSGSCEMPWRDSISAVFVHVE